MFRCGQILFKYRGVISAPFFILLLLFSRPVCIPVPAYVLIALGLALRLWAAGYLGERSRKNRFDAEYVVINGPYKYLKHPLYTGNFLLVCGVVILFNPPLWLGTLLIIVFITEYSIIARSEIEYLKNLPTKRTEYRLKNLKGELSTILVTSVVILLSLLKTRH